MPLPSEGYLEMIGRGSLEEITTPSVKEILAQRVKRPRIEDPHPSPHLTIDAAGNPEAVLTILPVTSVRPPAIGSEREDFPPSSPGTLVPTSDVDHFAKILEVITSHTIFFSVYFPLKHLSSTNLLILLLFSTPFCRLGSRSPKRVRGLHSQSGASSPHHGLRVRGLKASGARSPPL